MLKTATKYTIRLLALLALMSMFYHSVHSEAFDFSYRLGRSLFE